MHLVRGLLVTTDSDAIRAYISTLRAGRSLSQDDVAAAMGLARRTYIEWETGGTSDLKAPPLVRAIQFLQGRFEHLGMLIGGTEADGERLAQVQLSGVGASILDELLTNDDGRRAILERVYLMTKDPELRGQIRGYLDGIESSRP